MELIDFTGDDGVRYDGLWVAPRCELVVVHVHGKCGNFYQNDFIKTMLARYANQGIGFLAFNHRGHDCLAEAYRGGRVEYLGGSIESFADCLIDIDAAVSFATAFADKVVLQGHSNGCEKALYFASRRPRVLEGLLLLSPSDSYEMQRRYRSGESPEDQLVRLRSRGDRSNGATRALLLLLDEYGIRSGDKDYPIPVSFESVIDLLSGPALHVLNVTSDVEGASVCAVPLPSLVCLGSRDPYLTVKPHEMVEAIQVRSGPAVSLNLIEGADHHFHGYETELVDAIIEWCGQLVVG